MIAWESAWEYQKEMGLKRSGVEILHGLSGEARYQD